jgi:hypothetical protein
MITETFSATTKKDAGNTTADWNTTSGKLALNLLQNQTIDSYPESNYSADDVFVNVSFGKTRGQTFASNGEKITAVKFYLKKSGSPTGNAVVKIYAHTGVFGATGKPTGSALATSDNFDVSTLGTSYGLVTFTFSGANQYQTSTGIKYVAVMEYSSPVNFVYIGSDNTSPSHGGNAVYYDDGTSTWTAYTSSDFIFYVIGQKYDTANNIGQSLTLDSETSNIVSARVTKTDTTPSGTSITYQLSNDGGSHWQTFTPNTKSDFSSTGSDLRFKVTLNGTAVATPEVDTLNIEYTINPLVNASNAYSSNNSYATCVADDGTISVQLSKDGGANYHNVITKTFTGVEGVQAFGGSTELWGTTWTGDDIDDTSFRLKVLCGTNQGGQSVYKNFGFAIAGSTIVNGIEVDVEAKWDGTTTSIDHIKVKIWYSTSIAPVSTGSLAYATDGGTSGTLAAYDGSNWVNLVGETNAQTLTNKTLTSPKIDTINEETSAHGVIIDSLTIKDGEITQSSWTNATYQNSWVDNGTSNYSVGYMKDSMGFVHLRGVCKNGTAQSVIFTLPAGYRPSKMIFASGVANDLWGGIQIASNGQVSCFTNTNVYVCLDNILFKAEA